MKRGQAVRHALIAGWLVTALAVGLIAPLLVPEESRSVYFWYRVVWTETLILLFWGGAYIYFSVPTTETDSATRFGAVSPTMSIVIAVYSVMSFVAMVMHAFMPDGNLSNRLHWVAQIVLLSAASLFIIFLLIARGAAASGMAFDRTKALTPRELHDLIAAHESSLWTSASRELRGSVKQLKEALKYSLSESAALGTLPDYQKLSHDVEELCNSISQLSGGDANDAARLNLLNGSAVALTSRARLISAIQVRR